MTKYKLPLIVGIILLALLVACSSGGDKPLTEEDIANIQLVAAAYDNILTLDSVRMEGDNVVAQAIKSGDETINQRIGQQITAVMTFADADVTGLSSSVVQNFDFGVPGMGGRMTMDMIFAEDNLYVSVYDTTGAFASTMPDGWYNVSVGDPPDVFRALSSDQFLALLSDPVQYAITEDTVRSITVAEDQTSGQTTRVFTIRFNQNALRDCVCKAILGAMDFSSLGVDTDVIVEQVINNAQITVSVWIGDDGRIQRVNSAVRSKMTFDNLIPGSGKVDIDQTVTASFTYSDFNEPVVIAPPQ